MPELLEEAWESGIILAGLSAGAICWFQQGITDAWAGNLTVLDGLGFLEGSCCPHYDGEPERRPAYHRFMINRQISPGYALEDGAAIHFSGKKILRIVASRPEALAYRVDFVDNKVKEAALTVEYLGK